MRFLLIQLRDVLGDALYELVDGKNQDARVRIERAVALLASIDKMDEGHDLHDLAGELLARGYEPKVVAVGIHVAAVACYAAGMKPDDRPAPQHNACGLPPHSCPCTCAVCAR